MARILLAGDHEETRGFPTRRLKAGAGTPHVPLLAPAAQAMSGDRDRGLAAGCDGDHAKPVDVAPLPSPAGALAGHPHA